MIDQPETRKSRIWPEHNFFGHTTNLVIYLLSWDCFDDRFFPTNSPLMPGILDGMNISLLTIE